MPAVVAAGVTARQHRRRNIRRSRRGGIGDNPPVIFVGADIGDRDATLAEQITQRRARGLRQPQLLGA